MMAVNVEKVTVSLPREDMKKLREYEGEMQTSCSALFREAIELWLAVKERKRVKNMYARVYSRNKVVEDQRRLAEEMLPLAMEIWPEY